MRVALAAQRAVPLLTHSGPLVPRAAFATCSATGVSANAALCFSDIAMRWCAAKIFEPAVRLTMMAAGLIVCVGAVLTTINTFLFFINKGFGTRFRTVMDFWPVPNTVQLTRVKLQLGYTASVALQLLVVADVLDTLMKPSHSFSIEDLVKLAVIAGIRSVLALFLNFEVQECEKELEKAMSDGNVTI
eukprot:CAMPEP_0183340264 /NCGR_PEP_ID=MMETSP0164_2-20130417/6877_1 /TAXON_ID=221442 /ORGANISM="Coccolithus pelagicus ssp braarudi, Strain PLY182g" /LENGTH=187 /DNA_ID=CAMNT_0025510379 /DNA_START=27 /DNA_END=590 /DNA_ORIENTATION=+